MFTKLNMVSTDPIFKVLAQYKADTRQRKINLSIGIYTDEQGKPYVLPCIQKASLEIDTKDYNYQTLQGNKTYLENTAKLFLGSDVNLENIAMQASCGGTHGNRIFADLVLRESSKSIYLPSPTWGHHFVLFQKLNIKKIDHINAEHQINIENYIYNLEQAKQNDILLIHGGPTHNPLGINFSLEDLQTIVDLANKKQVFLLVDFAYLGLGNGFEEDAESLRFLWKNCNQIGFVASFSKNASLYEHRVGALFIKTEWAGTDKNIIEAQMQDIIRQSISNCPGFGQKVMNIIFDRYLNEWKTEVNAMRQSISNRRQILSQELGNEFSYLQNAHGMFSLLPLKAKQILQLQTESAIYMPENARINFGGLMIKDIPYLVEKLKAMI